MEVMRFEQGDTLIEVRVNQGYEVFIEQQFIDNDGAVFTGKLINLPVSALEQILEFVKECERKGSPSL